MTEPPAPVYVEPGRGWSSIGLFAGILLAGFLIDVGFGGASAHLLGWLVAAVLLLGVDALVIHSARVTKTLTVTSEEIRVGDEAIRRDEVVTASPDVDPEAPVLGWTTGLPRGRQGVLVELTGERSVVLPTRHPDRVQAVLGVAAPEAPQPAATVREATPDEFADLVEIDRRAEVVFTVAGMDLPEIPLPLDDLGRARVVFVVGEPVAGFAMVDEIDGLAHLSEIAVVPGSMRRGLGGALLDHVLTWAGEQGYPAVTLTTFRDVAWNGRFYRRHGFVEVDELTPGLAAARAREAELGLDAVGPRIAMRRELTSQSRPADRPST